VLLTISANSGNADDLSYLLHKHPDRLQTFDLSFGKAHVFYRETSAERVTACLLLDVDPVGMAKKNRGQSGQLAGYVNDRPYVTSSFMSTAIASVFGSAMAGRCKDRDEATRTPMDLTIHLESLPVKGGELFLRSLFEPLGYDVLANGHTLDSQFPQWGDSPYFSVELRATKTLAEVLNHLYVLIPVFDNQKHYFVGRDEIEKLLTKGEGWLAHHPSKEAITRRYLRHQGGMVRQALESLQLPEDGPDAEENDEASDAAEGKVESQLTANLDSEPSLNDQRHQAVVAQLTQSGVSRVVDLGCGEGKLLRRLLFKKQFAEIVGMLGGEQHSQQQAGFDDVGANYLQTMKQIVSNLQDLSARRKIVESLKRINDGIVSVELDHLQSPQNAIVGHQFHDRTLGLNLAQESEGFRRFFAHLLALYQRPPKLLLLFEHPEDGIHPGALSLLADEFNVAPDEGRGQVLLTTHSPGLLDNFDADSIRVVQREGFQTKIGPLATEQRESLIEELLQPGELLTVDLARLQTVDFGAVAQ